MNAHILSAREDPYGNPREGFTDDEIRDRRALVPNSDLAGIAEELQRVHFTLGTFQESVLAVDTNEVLEFRAGRHTAVRRETPTGQAVIRMSTTALRADWKRLCNHPVWSTYFPPSPVAGPNDDPCDPLAVLDQADWALDDIDIGVTLGGGARWEPAQSPLTGCTGFGCSELTSTATSAVLSIPFTMSLDPDPDDLVGALVDIKTGFIDGEIRVQLLPCAGPACSTGDRLAASYLGEGEAGDLTSPAPGFTMLVRSRLVRGDMRVEPTPGCELLWAVTAPVIQHTLGPIVPPGVPEILGATTTPGALTATCSELANFVEDTVLRPALATLASRIGSLIFASTLSAGFIRNCTSTPERCFRALQIAELCDVTSDPRSEANRELPICRFLESRDDAEQIVDSALRVVDLAQAEVDVPTSEGETVRMRLGARAARGDGFVAALAESNPVADTVLASIDVVSGVSISTACRACEDGDTASCTYCNFCRACGQEGAGLGCAELCAFFGPSIQLPTFERAENRSSAAHPLAIPTTRELWRVVDATPAISSYIQRLVARPFEARPGVTLREARICPGSPGCPSGHFGALLLLRVDLDRDGVDDDEDNCVGVANGDQANADGDAFGDACDLCPSHRSELNLPTACDCDADGDGCNNASISPDLACASTHGDDYFDEDALHASFVDDIDGDGRIGDCDDDDDGDGVLDDGAGDGIDVHTPCADGQREGCDDNCRAFADSSQRDSDGDFVGDVCEHLSDAICEKDVALCAWRSGLFDRFHLSGLAQRLVRLGTWGRGGPVVATLEKGGFLTIVGLSADGAGRRMVGLSALGVLDVESLAALSLTEVDDIDGDLEPDWAIGDPRSRDGRGRVVLASSRDGAMLDELVLEGPASGLGTSIAHHAGRLYVGAPRARDWTGEEVGAVIGFDLTAGSRHVFTTYGAGAGAELGVALVVTQGMAGPRIIAGAPGLRAKGEPDVGGVMIIDGSGAARTVVTGSAGGDRAGVSLAVLDAGPKPMVAVGAPAAHDGRGAVRIVDLHGRTVGTVGGRAGDALGTALVGLDQNGDGVDELAIGVPGRSSGQGGLVVVNHVGKELASAPGGPPGSRAGAALDAWSSADGVGLVVSLPGIASSDGSSAWIALRASSN